MIVLVPQGSEPAVEWLLEQSGNADSDVFSFNRLAFLLPGQEERGEATSQIDNLQNLERFGEVKCEEAEAIKEDEEGKSSDDESEDDDGDRSEDEAVDEEESTGDEDVGCYEDEAIKRRCSQARVEVGCNKISLPVAIQTLTSHPFRIATPEMFLAVQTRV